MQIVGFIICISRTIARYRNENNMEMYTWNNTTQRNEMKSVKIILMQ